jgi:uncharacterized membrane protein
VVGTTLSATCKNVAGQWTASSPLSEFNQCLGDIRNYNGQLHCDTGLAPPAGPYNETCRFIFTSGTTLTANCQNAGGKWVAETVLPNFDQCLDDINNYNGQLHCDMGSMPPPGPYRKTCQFIFTTGNRLTANCKNEDGEWAAQTSLLNFKDCHGSIVDFNGVLLCSPGQDSLRTPPNRPAVTYKITVLPLRPNHINELGQIAGVTMNHRAALWSEHAGLLEVPLPPGFSNSEATWVNNAGHVSGVIYGSESGQRKAFLFANTLLTLLPGMQSYAYSLNESDEVAGESLLPGKGTPAPVFWIKKAARPLGGCCGGSAKGIDENGRLIADLYDDSGRYHAFLWTAGLGLQPLGQGDSYSSAIAINAHGDVLVRAGSQSYFYADGRLIPLSLSSEYPNHPHALNNHDVVVGSFGLSFDDDRAFIWDKSHGFQDLNSCIASNSGWKLESATSINDRGDIVGVGDYKNQENVGFLLIPDE